MVERGGPAPAGVQVPAEQQNWGFPTFRWGWWRSARKDPQLQEDKAQEDPQERRKEQLVGWLSAASIKGAEMPSPLPRQEDLPVLLRTPH